LTGKMTPFSKNFKVCLRNVDSWKSDLPPVLFVVEGVSGLDFIKFSLQKFLYPKEQSTMLCVTHSMVHFVTQLYRVSLDNAGP
jgi:hypothetical protein